MKSRHSVLVVCLIGSIISILIPLSPARAEPVFSESQNLSSNSDSPFQTELSSSVDNLYVVWGDSCEDQTCIRFRASSDSGITFGNTITLESGDVIKAQIDSVGDDVYIVWQDRALGDNGNIRFASSHDAGATFSEPVTIGHGREPHIIASGNNLYLSWWNTELGDVFFRSSDDQGATFTQELNVSHSPFHSALPIMTVSDNGAIYIAWRDNANVFGEIFFAASLDGGQTFSDPINISNMPAFDSFDLSIAAAGNNVYVAWSEGFDDSDFEEGFLSASTDNGKTFSDPIMLEDNRAITLQVVGYGNNVIVSLVKDDGVTNRILFFASNNGGIDFTGPLVIGEGFGPQLAISHDVSPAISAAWVNDKDARVNFAFSLDGGASFTAPIDLGNTTFTFPRINWLDNDSVAVAWTSPDVGNGDVFLRIGSGFNGEEPAATIDGLLEHINAHINALEISNSLKTSLSAPLNQALALLDDDNPNNDSAVCGKLDAFINQVNVKVGKGLTSEQAQELLDEASSIKEALAC